jgi:hypothetical protein
MFLYTWRFFTTLERDEKSERVKLVYRWFARLTGFTVPAVFWAMYACYCIFYGKTVQGFIQDDNAEFDRYSHLVKVFSSVIGYVTTATNLLTCLMLGMVIRFVNKLTKQIQNTSI